MFFVPEIPRSGSQERQEIASIAGRWHIIPYRSYHISSNIFAFPILGILACCTVGAGNGTKCEFRTSDGHKLPESKPPVQDRRAVVDDLLMVFLYSQAIMEYRDPNSSNVNAHCTRSLGTRHPTPSLLLLLVDNLPPPLPCPSSFLLSPVPSAWNMMGNMDHLGVPIAFMISLSGKKGGCNDAKLKCYAIGGWRSDEMYWHVEFSEYQSRRQKKSRLIRQTAADVRRVACVEPMRCLSARKKSNDIKTISTIM